MAAKFSRVPVSSFSADKEARETDVRLHESLVTDLESLLEDQASTDLEFVARGGKVKAHRLIVLCRCKEDKTKKLLRGAGEQKVVSVRLENFNARTVRTVVRYLYSGKVCLCVKAILVAHVYSFPSVLNMMLHRQSCCTCCTTTLLPRAYV